MKEQYEKAVNTCEDLVELMSEVHGTIIVMKALEEYLRNESKVLAVVGEERMSGLLLEVAGSIRLVIDKSVVKFGSIVYMQAPTESFTKFGGYLAPKFPSVK